MDTKKTPENIDAYIAEHPLEVQLLLIEMRNLILELAPEATECISWGMPTFKINKILVQFAAFKKHLGFFPHPDTIVHFQEKLTSYKTSKGGIQFPYSKPIPFDLVKRIVNHNRELLLKK